ncbi:MAG: type I restriction enzyme HsdR N-terminal domain-containing protein [Muribaculaceae bacterium]|nr:type I restriction enzyme HsdR N-terminal domain-containing protein [Muribaculaceae bacterium]
MPLNLPEYPLKVKKNGSRLSVFDRLRKRYVALTPEEWVRQHFVEYLIEAKQFPAALMANEVSLTQNGIKRRCDTLVADREGKPLVIVEYKAPEIEITQQVFDQIVRYNMVFRARYLMVSNGMAHYCCQIDYENNTYSFLSEIPCYDELQGIS